MGYALRILTRPEVVAALSMILAGVGFYASRWTRVRDWCALVALTSSVLVLAELPVGSSAYVTARVVSVIAVAGACLGYAFDQLRAR